MDQNFCGMTKVEWTRILGVVCTSSYLVESGILNERKDSNEYLETITYIDGWNGVDVLLGHLPKGKVNMLRQIVESRNYYCKLNWSPNWDWSPQFIIIGPSGMNQ